MKEGVPDMFDAIMIGLWISIGIFIVNLFPLLVCVWFKPEAKAAPVFYLIGTVSVIMIILYTFMGMWYL